ncbi:T9SS type A sorting domain-containing protein [Winogradskyella sp.]|uniref:T9SS type A sorting domain-containing protein n=1 Tax=Winogradskyella sp. TaxID=1883156 RepID=UPI0026064BCB|nr:T9SS type A sorting domain-containing protein [uncultured Winogradskyella sp.]
MKKIYFLFFSLLISSLSFGQDLLLNGNFETWTDANTPTSWTKIENVDQESIEVHGGNYAVMHTADGTKDLGQTITGITPGNNYTISLWYKVDAGAGDGTDARIWSYWKDSTDGNINDNADELRGPNNSYFDANGNQWTEYSVTLTAPANAAGFYFEVRSYGSAIVYWDDFSFVEQAVTTPSVNIDSPADATVFNPGTTSVDIEFSTLNIDLNTAGNQVNVTVDSNSTDADVTSPYAITTTDGQTYNVTVDLLEGGVVVDTKNVSFSVASSNSVANITALRAGTTGEFYELTGEAVISYIVTEGTRNQKYIQDGDAGILIDDTAGTLSTSFNIGDGITGLKGQLTEYAGTLQFVPSENVASASSTGNVLTPIVVSAADLITNGETYESRLITLNNVTFEDTGVFADNTNYNVADGSDVTVCRVAFGDEDIIGTAIPTTASSITGLGGEFNGTYQIFPRYASDIAAPLSVNSFNASKFSLFPNPTNTGFVNIASNNDGDMSVEAYDILGKRVKYQTLTNNTSLNVSDLKSGVYILKITQNNATTTKKLVIK